MKVGEWARYTHDLDSSSEVRIDKIKYIHEEWLKVDEYANSIDFDECRCCNPLNILKTSPNLEDLLEVGDMVEYTPNWWQNITFTHHITDDSILIKILKEIDTTKSIKIVLHENLQWQEVDYEQTS